MAAIPQHFEYTIRPGDTLHGIITKMYGVSPQSAEHAKCQQYLLALNPQIKDPNRIRSGDVLRLTEHLVSSASQGQQPPAGVMSTPLISQGVPAGPESAGYYAVSWLANNSNYFLLPGSTATGFGAGVLSTGNLAYIREMDNLYASYKGDGTLSKGQYDYRRAQALKKFQTQIGPIDRLLFGQGTSQQALRIARAGGVPANANLAHHAARLKRLGQVANIGGIALTGVGVAASCVQIANTVDQREKNLILVESATSSGTSLIAGAAIGFFLASNPIGWGTMLVLAVGATAASYASGKVGRVVYDNYLNHLDPVSGLGIDRICR